MLTRRTFLATSAAAAALTPFGLHAQQQAAQALSSMTGDVVPISREEYQARIDKARRLMAAHGLGAILIEPGASLTYFTGVQWWRSERLTAAVVPVSGDPARGRGGDRHPAFRGAVGPREPQDRGRRPCLERA